MNWTEYFLNIAESVKLRSKDPRTHKNIDRFFLYNNGGKYYL